MNLFSHQYRQLFQDVFSSKENRLVLAIPSEAVRAERAQTEVSKEAGAKAPEKTEPLKKEFEVKKEKAKDFVTAIAGSINDSPQTKNLAEKLKSEEHGKIDTDFGQLQKNYDTDRQQLIDSVGLGNKDAKEKLANYDKSADKLVKAVKERIGGGKAKELIEHRTLQEQLSDPTKTREAQIKIIESYLKKQDLKVTELTPYIVEAMLGSVNLTAKTPEDLKKALDTALTDKNSNVIKDAVAKVIEATPKLQTPPDDNKINIFRAELEDKRVDKEGIYKNFGRGEGNANIEAVAKTLATRFHVEFEKNPDGKPTTKPAMFVDLMDNNKIYTPQELKTELPNLINRDYKSSEDIKPQQEKTEEAAKKQQELFDEIKEGLITVARGGSVKELSDLKDHPELQNLIKMTEKVTGKTKELEAQAKKVKEEANRKAEAEKKAAEELAKQETERKANVDKYKTMREGVKTAASGDGLSIETKDVDKSKPGDKDEMTIKKEGKTVATITLEIGKEKMTVTIDKFKKDFKTPEEFKTFADKMGPLDQIPAKIEKTNQESLEKLTKKITDLDKKIKEYDFKMPEKPDLSQDGATVDVTITNAKKENMGILNVSLAGDEKATMRLVTDGGAKVDIRLKELTKDVIEKNIKELTEKNAKIKENKDKITGFGNQIKPPNGFTKSEAPSTVDFSNNDAQLRLTIKNESSQDVGFIDIKSNGEITLTLATGKTEKFTDVNALNTKLASEKLLPSEVLKGREKAKEALKKFLYEAPEIKKLLEEKPALHEKIDQYIVYIINHLPETDVKSLEEGKDIKATTENIRVILDAYRSISNKKNIYEGPKKEEMELVANNLKLGDKSFKDVFGENSPITETLSRLYLIEPGESGKGIKIDGKQINDTKELKPYLDDDKGGFDKATDLSKPEEQKKALEALNKLAIDSNKSLADIQNLIGGMEKALGAKAQAEGTEAGPEKKGGFFEAISALLQLYQAIMNAIENKDMKTLEDFLKDFNEEKDPSKLANRIKECKDAYAETVKKLDPAKTDLNDLLIVREDTRGAKADELFLKDAPKGKENIYKKYRNEAKPAIDEYLQTNLGITEMSVSKMKSGWTKISAYKENQKVEIVVGRKDAKTVISINTITTKDEEVTDKDGKKSTKQVDKTETLVAETQINTVAQLKDMIAKAPAQPAPSAPAKPAVEPAKEPAKREDKPAEENKTDAAKPAAKKAPGKKAPTPPAAK